MKLNKFININLNQTISKFEMLEIQKEKNRWYIFSSITFAFFIILILNFYLLERYNKLISSRLDKAYSLIRDAKEIREKYESYNIDVSISEDDINQLYKIESDRISLANKLQSISDLIPNEMSLENLKYNYDTNKIELILLVDTDNDIYSRNMDILAKNLVSLENLKEINTNQNFGLFGDDDFSSYDYERVSGKNKNQKYYKVEVILSKWWGFKFKMNRNLILFISTIVFVVAVYIINNIVTIIDVPIANNVYMYNKKNKIKGVKNFHEDAKKTYIFSKMMENNKDGLIDAVITNHPKFWQNNKNGIKVGLNSKFDLLIQSIISDNDLKFDLKGLDPISGTKKDKDKTYQLYRLTFNCEYEDLIILISELEKNNRIYNIDDLLIKNPISKGNPGIEVRMLVSEINLGKS